MSRRPSEVSVIVIEDQLINPKRIGVFIDPFLGGERIVDILLTFGYEKHLSARVHADGKLMISIDNDEIDIHIEDLRLMMAEVEKAYQSLQENING